jgi:deoxyribodipyrimidine photo-lyase
VKERAHIVWFKRDLRTSDHAPLAHAASAGRIVALYVYEPELLAQEEHHPAHLTFVNESLVALDKSLRSRGVALTLRVGRLPQVFEELAREFEIAGVWSHQETGNAVTFARDLRVAEWCRSNGVPWREYRQDAVVRRLASRDGWAHRREVFLASVVPRVPPRIAGLAQVPASTGILGGPDLGLASHQMLGAQPGGWEAGRATLRSFLRERSVHYASSLSSPVSGWEGCSRMSPHLAYGTVSLREVVGATRAVQRAIRGHPGRDTRAHLRSLAAYEARLAWRCHFIQKLESEPSLEFLNGQRVTDCLRKLQFDAGAEARFQRFVSAETGYPFVDACLRCLARTGWLNFRMRAMLASFSSFDLWLHWRRPATYLARLFLDFEPGIHFSQFQMQAGTMGINTLRMYSPVKQQKDQDADGRFVRQWIPELAHLPTEYLAAPWTMPPLLRLQYGFVLGRDYPEPVVNHNEAVAFAKRAFYPLRSRPEAREEARVVQRRHGSRLAPETRDARMFGRSRGPLK